MSEQPRIKFFGRRKGKRIRAGRELLLEELLPKIQVHLPTGEGEKLEPCGLFADSFYPKEVWLEVGFGGGEHLAGQALAHKDIGFIGAEVFVNGVASLLAHLAGTHEDGAVVVPEIAAERGDNVRVYNDDVRPLLERLPDESVGRIFVLFPDPWPKKRHADRRFIGPANLPQLLRILKKGGELRVASDDMGYIRWSLSHLIASPEWEWTAQKADDWNKPPADWIPTRYEQKAIRLGKKPIYLTFRKR